MQRQYATIGEKKPSCPTAQYGTRNQLRVKNMKEFTFKPKLTEATEPLIELLYQEFPNKDPQEVERIIKTRTKMA